MDHALNEKEWKELAKLQPLHAGEVRVESASRYVGVRIALVKKDYGLIYARWTFGQRDGYFCFVERSPVNDYALTRVSDSLYRYAWLRAKEVFCALVTYHDEWNKIKGMKHTSAKNAEQLRLI